MCYAVSQYITLTYCTCTILYINAFNRCAVFCVVVEQMSSYSAHQQPGGSSGHSERLLSGNWGTRRAKHFPPVLSLCPSTSLLKQHLQQHHGECCRYKAIRHSRSVSIRIWKWVEEGKNARKVEQTTILHYVSVSGFLLLQLLQSGYALLCATS